VKGIWKETGAEFSGYEIHMGQTEILSDSESVLDITERNGMPVQVQDGVVSKDSKIWGIYVHGFFDQPSCARALLTKLKPECTLMENNDVLESPEVFKDRQYNLLSDHFYRHLRMPLLEDIFGFSVSGEEW
jgi:adenosylcobyric acid synthase